MNFKKVFVTCLSSLFAFSSSASSAMDEKIYNTECYICFNPVTAENRIVTECGHQHHTNCLYMWGLKKNACPICRNPLNINMNHNQVDLQEIYNAYGIIDIHQLPGMEGKSNEELLQFLVAPVKRGECSYMGIRPFTADSDRFKGEIYYFPMGETGCGKSLKVNTPMGRKKVGILDENLWKDFRDAVKEAQEMYKQKQKDDCDFYKRNMLNIIGALGVVCAIALFP